MKMEANLDSSQFPSIVDQLDVRNGQLNQTAFEVSLTEKLKLINDVALAEVELADNQRCNFEIKILKS
jgi:hypothetical protein